MVYRGFSRRAGLAAAIGALALGVLPMPAGADIVHNDDVIILFSLCVGNDCVNGESFGFDTLRLKENNVRVHFDDTSNSASFPRNDWRLVANDSSNGGGEYFRIEDSTAGRAVFQVEAGAIANALYVDSSGDVGIGTATPVVDLHAVDGNTPTLRLEQDGSSGFTPQTWDVAGNEANFFVRDATNGSKLPFKIRPNAPTDSIVIAGSSGNIGLGTSSPSSPLHIRRSSGEGAGFRVETAGSTTPSDWYFQANAVTGAFLISNVPGGNAQFQVFPNQPASTLVVRGGKVGIGTQNPGATLDVQGSIKQRTTVIHPDYVFEPDYQLESIDDHAAYMWENKHLPAVGPGTYDAEGKALIELGERSQALLEELEKAHIYIQQLHERLKSLEDRLHESGS